MSYEVPLWIVGSIALVVFGILIMASLIPSEAERAERRRLELQRQREQAEREAARLRGLMAISQNARRLH